MTHNLILLTTCVCTPVKLKTLHYITLQAHLNFAWLLWFLLFRPILAFQLSSFSDPFLLPHSSVSNFTTWSPPLLSSQFRLCASGPECSVLSSDSFERACFRMGAKKHQNKQVKEERLRFFVRFKIDFQANGELATLHRRPSNEVRAKVLCVQNLTQNT